MDTKLNILLESSILFAKYGYASSSVRNIAAKVGIRESAIYNHFNSKNDVLSAILEDAADIVNCKNLLTDEMINLLTDPPKFLNLFTMHLFERWKQDKEKIIFTIVFKEEAITTFTNGVNLSEYIKNLNGILEIVFSEMIKHNFIAKLNPEKLAEFFFAPLIQFRIKNLLYQREISDEEIENYIELHISQFFKFIELR